MFPGFAYATQYILHARGWSLTIGFRPGGSYAAVRQRNSRLETSNMNLPDKQGEEVLSAFGR